MYDYDNIIGLLCQIHIAMCANKQMYVKKRNSMIKVAVCDDELSVLSELSVLIDTYRVEQNQEISYTMFQSPLELLAEVEKGMCWDVLFLDILMPGENGIDVAKEIRQFDTKVNIIFLTSSSEFAVQSYMVDAYFYQLKPIWKESFFQLMNSVVAECERTEPLYLILKCKTGITRIDIDKLKYCEVMGRKLLFHMEDGHVYECVGSMEALYEQLSQYDCFLRPHRSYLINMEFIQNISNKTIMMSDFIEIPVPHGKYSEVRDKYLEYTFSRKQVVLYD